MVTTTFGYDALNRRTAVTEAANDVSVRRTTAMAYDATDNLALVIDPRGLITVSSYDELNRRTSTTEAVGTYQQRTTFRSYDAADNMTAQTTGVATGLSLQVPNFNHPSTTEYNYDTLNRRTQVTIGANDAASKQETSFVYLEKSDNLLRQIDDLWNSTWFEYDSLSRRVRVTDPLGNATTTIYYSNDREWQVIQPASQGNPLHIFSYNTDALGRRILMVDGYEAAGGRVTWFKYDSDDHVREITNPDNQKTTYIYDPYGRLRMTGRTPHRVPELFVSPCFRQGSRPTMMHAGTAFMEERHGYAQTTAHTPTYPDLPYLRVGAVLSQAS